MSNFNANTATVAHDVIPITPSDGSDLTIPVRALLFITAGTVRILTAAGRDITLSASFPIGYILPVAVRRVFATGTSAAVVGLI